MKLDIEINERVLKQLVLEHIKSKLGDNLEIGLDDIKIETKSKQNYRSEWEESAFRATLNVVDA